MPPFTARMSGDLVILAYPEGSAFYLVKIGLHSDLRREYEGLVAGHAAFPEGAPEPLALASHRSFPTLVMTGIAFEPLGRASMHRPSPTLKRALTHYFATAARAFRVADPQRHSASIREAFSAPWARSLDDNARAYVEAVAADADSVPSIRQHGDFYLGNLGLAAGHLAIFDWEDFGRECLAGLDLAQLLLSLNEFDVRRLREQTRPGGPQAWLVSAACAGIGLSPALFDKLIPAYLALLGRMKSELGYGHVFAQRVLRALRDALSLAASTSGDSR